MISEARDFSLSPVVRAVVLLLRVLLWLTVAGIPVAIDHVITAFMVERCLPGSDCLKNAMPLIVNVGVVNLCAYALLWPLSAWFLGGRWIVVRCLKKVRPVRWYRSSEHRSVPTRSS